MAPDHREVGGRGRRLMQQPAAEPRRHPVGELEAAEALRFRMPGHSAILSEASGGAALREMSAQILR
jgi:hypothetical protein